MVKLRIGWGSNILYDLCEHIQLPHVSLDLRDPEYYQMVLIKCKVCDITFDIEVGVN